MNSHFDDLIGQDSTTGNDGDQPGFSNPISATEIEDLLYSDEWPAETRIARLRELRAELSALGAGDLGEDDPRALVRQIDGALAQLTGNDGVELDPEGAGLDSSGHRETLSPDSDELADLRALDEADDPEAPLDPQEWSESDGFDPEQGVR